MKIIDFRKNVIIVAGGIGARMKTKIPKQYLEIQSEPIIIKTIKQFIKAYEDIKIILVINESYKEYTKEILKKNELLEKIIITNGGKERYNSVKNGFELCENGAIVGIHDGVRPYVSRELIKRTYEEANKLGNAIPLIPIVESIRMVKDKESWALRREEYYIVQTPQCFKYELLEKAFKQGYKESFTDEATMVEEMGVKINWVEGERGNKKITYGEDLMVND